VDVKELMKKATMFHGHLCPGIAIGTLVAKYVLEHGFEHSLDEELVAVVENDNCSVDALQALIGTTYGKGNLVHKDYGKNNYTIYSRKSKKAIKFTLKSTVFTSKKKTRDEKIQKLLNSNPEDVFNITEVEFDPPGMAQIEDSVPCAICSELTMSSRLVNYQGSNMCIPCYKRLKK